MKPIRLGVICAAAVVVTLAIAVFASADSERGALEVQSEVAHAGLVPRLEATLGDSFGGAWYEPSGEQLHVGVTSGADRRAAEAVAARAGVADDVTATAVDSTWQQLEAAQKRLATDLADLLTRGEVSTALAPDYNAVEVSFGSAVPARRRAQVERKARVEGVALRTVEVSQRHIRVEKQLRCKEFAEDKAYCDPTIVAGVTIKGGGTCTAGPAVVLQNQQSSLMRTATYILTAGHCIDEGGGLGVKWSSFSKGGTSTEIGPAVDFLNAETDVGVIEVSSTSKWLSEGNVPVVPMYATWNPKAESDPYGVLGQQAPIKNAKTCMSGQSTSTTCGTIAKVKAEVEWGKGVVGKELVEVEGATTKKGDSGAPWYSNDETTIGYVEGTHVGRNPANSRPVFQPLEVSFAKLATKLRLLDETNDARHPFRFVSEGTPTTLTGKKSGEKEVFTTEVGSTTCKGATYTGEMVGTALGELSLTPTYSECTMAGLAATVDVNGCKYSFEPEAEAGFATNVDLVCPAGKQMEFTSTPCKVTVPPQSNLKTATFSNTGAGATRELSISLNLSNIAYEEHKSGLSACTSTVPKSNGTYKGTILITGETGAATHRGIWVE